MDKRDLSAAEQSKGHQSRPHVHSFLEYDLLWTHTILVLSLDSGISECLLILKIDKLTRNMVVNFSNQ